MLQDAYEQDLRHATAAAAPYLARASCKKGCAACCRQHTGCTPLEAILMARAIHLHPRAAELWHRVEAQAELVRAHPDCQARFNARVACPLLEPDGTCAAYEARPTSCRQLAVHGDPAACAPPALQTLRMDLEVAGLFQLVRLQEFERTAQARLQGGGAMALELTLALDVLRRFPAAEEAWAAGGWPFEAAVWPCRCGSPCP